VNFRLVCASHKDLQGEMEAGRFREDLYYRVSEIQLILPPLRDRSEDVPLLAQTFIDQYLKEQGEKTKVQLGKDLLKEFMNYPWPGNVRELQNVVRVATALRQGSVLHFGNLPESLQGKLRSRGAKESAKRSNGETAKKNLPVSPSPRLPVSQGSHPPGSFKLFDPQQSWRDMEVVVVAKALDHFHFDVTKAAQALSCAPSKLYQRVREYGLEARREEWAAHPFVYSPKKTLEEIKREIFKEALEFCGGSPYQTARLLKVSPGMVYQWMEK